MVWGNSSGKEKMSEAAILIGGIFDDDNDKSDFLDLVIARFANFDESNQVAEDKTFSDDVTYITQCTMASLTSKKSNQFESRIDSYFFIYRRLEDYSAIKKGSNWIWRSSTSDLETLQQKFYETLSSEFTLSRGAKPNLCINDKDLLKRMNIVQHLSSITTIDIKTLSIFFALCKLAMQSSLLLDDDHNRLKWLDILSRIRDIKMSLRDFITQYIDYKGAFGQFPLDMPAFIHLIQRMHPSKQSQLSPFAIFINLYRLLELQQQEFFELFQPIFIKGVENKRYEIQHISELFRMLRKDDRLFSTYLLVYSSHEKTDDLWDMFIHLSVISDFTEPIRRYVPVILSTRISKVSVYTFLRYAQSARTCLSEIKAELRPYFIEIFEKIYDDFIIKQLQDSQFTETDLKDLLKIGLLLSSTHSIKRPSCLLLIRELLLKMDTRIKNTAEKIKQLFKNLNSFDENLCKNQDPIEIIEDDWLKNFLILNPQVWSKLDHDIYKYLCDNHKNNRWTIYIWSRIVHLSLLKLINDNPNEILFKLEEWMKKVKHDIYDPTDILTHILVVKLFELVIVKHMRSLLSLPNIETIMNFIIYIRKNQSYRIDTMQVDIVFQNGGEILQEILQLKGK